MLLKTNRIAAFLLVLLLTTFSVSAADGDGDGSGDGGGRERPLTLESASVANGAENVDPNVRIVLTFSKNVVHMNVCEHNKTCFSVKNSAGNAVPIYVEMGDDQVDPDVKRIVTVAPQSPYQPGETYVLKISGELTAKNEVNKLGKDVYLSFTIRSGAQTKPPAQEKTTVPRTTSAYAAPSYTPDVPQETTTAPAAAPAPDPTTASAATTASRAAQPPSAAASTAPRERITRVPSPTVVTQTASSVPSTAGTSAAAPAVPPSVSAETADAESVSETREQTEQATSALQAEETTAAPETADGTSANVSETAQPAQGEARDANRRSAVPAILLGIAAVSAAAAAAFCIIKQFRKKKG